LTISNYFHAKEHWNLRSKAYHGISKAEREQLLERLVLHLHHRFLFGASVVIDEADYRSYASPRFRSQYGPPYGWGFQTVIVMILAELVKQGKANQPVNLLIEDGHANADQAMGFIKRKRELNAKKGLRVETYSKGGKKDNPFLQAADVLAFGVCEFHAKGHSDFAARLATPKYRKRFHEYYSDRVSVELAKCDIKRNRDHLDAGTPGAKRLKEMVMW
jgi:hypothetical protein